WSDIIAPLGRRLFTIHYRRALPYAMIFCPFRALIHCIDTVLDKSHNVKSPQKTKQSVTSNLRFSFLPRFLYWLL
ncbi:MAG: hypothetical protein LBQ66_14900, partial [Planctomycetaceae bacterium]|nr:hypothetical protein [Planctomycetaceae bacterium]